MPTYCFKNPTTDECIELTMSVSEMEKSCDGDWIDWGGVKYQRDYQREMSGAPTGCAAWPMKSDAAGVHPEQAKEFTELSAKRGVPTEFDSKTGQAIFTSRKHRAQYLKSAGMHDRNGGYGD
tara:strand:- start:118 stop:483 length:366 start_codon:yes stop_codon:yes gene_type:complete